MQNKFDSIFIYNQSISKGLRAYEPKDMYDRGEINKTNLIKLSEDEKMVFNDFINKRIGKEIKLLDKIGINNRILIAFKLNKPVIMVFNDANFLFDLSSKKSYTTKGTEVRQILEKYLAITVK